MTDEQLSEVEADPWRPVELSLRVDQAHLVAWALSRLAAHLLHHPEAGARGDPSQAVELACVVRTELRERGLIRHGVE